MSSLPGSVVVVMLRSHLVLVVSSENVSDLATSTLFYESMMLMRISLIITDRPEELRTGYISV